MRTEQYLSPLFCPCSYYEADTLPEGGGIAYVDKLQNAWIKPRLNVRVCIKHFFCAYFKKTFNYEQYYRQWGIERNNHYELDTIRTRVANLG